MSVLEQNHNAFDEHLVLDTVLRGNKPLYEVKTEMDTIYAKEDFSDADGDRVGELQICIMCPCQIWTVSKKYVCY